MENQLDEALEDRGGLYDEDIEDGELSEPEEPDTNDQFLSYLQQMYFLFHYSSDDKWYVFFRKVNGVKFKIISTTSDSMELLCTVESPPIELLHKCPGLNLPIDDLIKLFPKIESEQIKLPAPFELQCMDKLKVEYYPDATNAQYSLVVVPSARKVTEEINL